MQLIESAILGFLLFDIFADHLLIFTHRGHEVSARPEIVASEILPLTKEAPCNVDGTFALDETHHLGNAVLGWNADEHVDMVHQQMTFHYLALTLHRKLSEYLPQMLSELFIEGLPSVFGNPYHMVLAVPRRVA